MASTKRLTAVQRARRKKITALIRAARATAKAQCLIARAGFAQLLDDLADVAEQYLKGLK